jgi:clan AA aspartic protease (TIGR02281 family)
MDLVLIPAGEFQMGSPDSDTDAQIDETPQHRVRITRPFYIGIYEVTQREYQRVMGANPAAEKISPRHPVEMISWFDAVSFCNRLSEMEHLPPFCAVSDEKVKILGGAGYRLPTEAEWEYACRGGTTTKWSWGDELEELSKYAWCKPNAGNNSHPVGQKNPNPFGLYDMHGHLWEWCWDWYGEDYYRRSPVDDPQGPGSGYLRVERGGDGWNYDPPWLRSAYRDHIRPVSRFINLGFRVVRGDSPVPPEQVVERHTVPSREPAGPPERQPSRNRDDGRSLPAAPGAAEEPSGEGAMKKHGLRRSGTTYVLADEAEVEAKLKEGRALYKRLVDARLCQRQVEQAVAEDRMMIQGLTQQRMVLNQQLSRPMTAQENNRLVGTINGLTDQIDLIRQQSPSAATVQEVAARVPVQREAYVQAVLDVRRLVDQITQTYAELAKEEEVTSALSALNRKSKAKLTLGPSRTFQSNAKMLQKTESSVLSEAIPVRREGGIYWLDVTFNGKVTRPMAYDTGASTVVLPATMAAEIGLKPGAGDPTTRVQVADGSVIEVKQMTIPSVRVGKFTVKDVPCVVMPADRSSATALLGQTFLQNFTHKFNSATGSLVLTRVETSEAEKALPRTKATKGSSAKKGQAPAGE